MSFTGSGSPPQGLYWVMSSNDAAHVGRGGGNTQVNTNTGWVAGLAVYVPFVIPVASTVYEWWVYTGTLTTAHNLDYGIYNADFTKIQSLGSTAGGTVASTINNTATWTDLVLLPGVYYMAFCDDSTRNFLTSSDAAGVYQAVGIMEQTGLSSTLPDPMVPVVYTRAFLPHFGINMWTTAV